MHTAHRRHKSFIPPLSYQVKVDTLAVDNDGSDEEDTTKDRATTDNANINELQGWPDICRKNEKKEGGSKSVSKKKTNKL